MKRKNRDEERDSINPRSLVQLIEGEAFEKALEKVPDEYWALSEEDLQKLAKPSRTDYALKLAFWNEIRLAGEYITTIKPQRIYGGICSYANWHQNMLSVPEKLAWLLCPLREYQKSLEPILYCMVERYWEIMQLPFYDKKGNVISGNVKAVLQVSKQVEDRVLGSAVQRSVSQTQSVQVRANVDSDIGIRPGESETAHMARLDKRLKELEEEERKLMHLPAPKIDN
ncbi:hypothetical protein K2X30_15770 [bacterium]|nr:hypothetical protein [bacterium]